jgi:hypothetical protein
MTKFSLAVLALATTTVVACGSRGADEIPTGEALTAELVRLMQQGDEAAAEALIEQAANQRMRGSIRVQGVVVDTSGRPINDVQMSFKQVSIAGNMSESSTSLGERTVDGSFELDCEDCSAMEATFSKDGYQSVRHEWIAFSEAPIAPGVIEPDYIVELETLPDR